MVVGLIYADNLGGFGFHLWNEVYVNRRWVALDAAFDQSAVDAVHIKLTDSNPSAVLLRSRRLARNPGPGQAGGSSLWKFASVEYLPRARITVKIRGD